MLVTNKHYLSLICFLRLEGSQLRYMLRSQIRALHVLSICKGHSNLCKLTFHFLIFYCEILCMTWCRTSFYKTCLARRHLLKCVDSICSVVAQRAKFFFAFCDWVLKLLFNGEGQTFFPTLIPKLLSSWWWPWTPTRMSIL